MHLTSPNLSLVLVIGLAGYSMIALLRALPPFRQLVAEGRKPWACHTCMASYWGIACGIPYALAAGAFIGVLVGMGGAGVCLALFTALPPGPPPGPPDPLGGR
jgi:hypothetical protein